MSAESQSGVYMEAAAPVAEVQQTNTAGANQEQHVPLSALQAERAQRQQVQADKERSDRMYQEHIALLQANQYKQPAQVAQPDMSDTDVLTYGEFKRLVGDYQQQVQSTVEQVRVQQRYPDYQEVIKYLPEVVKENPELQGTLERSTDYGLAYHLAKNSDSYRNATKVSKRSAEAERIVQNSQQSGSLASMGQATPVSFAKNYKGMSDADFMKEMQRNIGY